MNKKKSLNKSETNKQKTALPQVIQTGENGGEIHLHIHLDAGQQVQVTFQAENLPPKATATKQSQSIAAETPPDSETSITPIPAPTHVETSQALKGIPEDAEPASSPLLDVQLSAFSRQIFDKIRFLFSKTKKKQAREEQSSKPKRKINLETWLFGTAVVIYLLTRLIGLPNFPIFFFTDEAVQSVTASDFVNNGFKNSAGVLLPTYFENGSQYNLGTSVYLQIIPSLLFEKSVWVTRGTAALATLLAAFGLGLILRDIFKVRNWWLGPLLLAAVPTWFLHSRTAFETTLMASFYTVFLYFYLRYRYDKPKYLYPALIMGALAFYAYSPGQLVVVVTGLVMIFSDLRYHWQNRKTALIGLAILALLIAPYARFRITQASEFTHHLQMLESYWLEPIPLWEKLGNYFTRYIRGLNPAYWYLPNELDLIRHRMKGMSNIPLLTLPFALIGLWQCIKNFRSSAHRLAIFALLAAPTGAAIVDIAITRVMVFVIPATLLTALGIEATIQWLVKQKIPDKLPRLITFGVLTIFSFWMLREALVNGPLWYEDYSLYGMQYGGSQVFTEINKFHEDYPDKNIIVSPSWANGTDVIARYFLGDPMPITMGTIEAYAIDYIPLDENTIFVMTPTEYEWMLEIGKFTNVKVQKTLPYPDGTPGFYFVTLDYVDNFDEILAVEIEARRQLREEVITINDLQVTVQYPQLDINEIIHAFDGDDDTLIRTFEANPLKIILTFPEPLDLNSVTALVGGTTTKVTAYVKVVGEEEEKVFFDQVGEATVVRAIELNFGETLTVDKLTIEVLNVNDGDISHVHLWEIKLK